MKAIGWAGISISLWAIGAACVGEDEGAALEMTATSELAATTGPAGTTQQTLVARRDSWGYYDRGALVGSSWRSSGECGTGGACFTGGAAPLGYGEGYIRTTVSFGSNSSDKHRTTYFRMPFAAPVGVRALFLRVMYDDGFAFYLNGHEGGRASMPSGTIGPTTLALGHEADERYVTFDVSAQIPHLVTDSYTNWLAFEVHQATASSSDLVFDAELIAWVDAPVDVTTHEEIPERTVWHFWDRASVPASWTSPTLDDSHWSAGQSPLGYGEPYIETPTTPGTIATYFRKQFTIEGSVHGLSADVMYDDGFVAYLNGTEIQRAAMPTGPVGPSTKALDHEAGGSLEHFDWDAALPLLVHGTNTLAVEVHQTAATSSDLSFALGLDVEGAWTVQDSGTTDWLFDIASTDGNHAWAVGTRSVIMRTTDGGATWTRQAMGTTGDLYAIQFTDALHGWIVGADSTVLRTVDGGAFWTPLGGVDAVIYDVSFIDANTGWIAGLYEDDYSVRLYRTDDAGATWVPQVIQANSLSDLEMVDAQHGWARGYALVDDRPTLYYTADGGLTWSERWIGGHQSRMGEIAALDANTAVMVGANSVHDDTGEVKMITHDAGLTWETLPTTSSPLALIAVDFVGDAGWAVGAGGVILHSDDAGETWSIQQVGRYHYEDRLNGDPPYYTAIHLSPDGLSGWAVGGPGAILHTSTGGF